MIIENEIVRPFPLVPRYMSVSQNCFLATVLIYIDIPRIEVINITLYASDSWLCIILLLSCINSIHRSMWRDNLVVFWLSTELTCTCNIKLNKTFFPELEC